MKLKVFILVLKIIHIHGFPQSSNFDSSKPKTCKTAGPSIFNPNPNKECIFPFTFKGTEFNKCSEISTSEGSLNNICATETQGKANELTEYGVCSKDCNIENGK